MTSHGIYPRSVTPGIENQSKPDRPPQLPPQGSWVGLDWVRVTGSEVLEQSVRNYINSRFGDDFRVAHPAKFFSEGMLWESGLLLSTGHRSRILMVDVRGEHLKAMSGDDRTQLLSDLIELGLKPTRIDGALDLVELDRDLYGHALASCQAGELCHLRRYSFDPEYYSGGSPTRLMLKLGKRDSPVCARIYDKGLEQGLVLPRIWERLEVEWKKDKAPAITERIVKAGSAWSSVLASLIVGAIDFRQCNGRSELKRRPRSDWWANLIENIQPVKAKATPTEGTFNAWLTGFQTSYGRRIVQLASSCGMTVGAFVEVLLSMVNPAEGKPALVRECVSLMGSEGAER